MHVDWNTLTDTIKFGVTIYSDFSREKVVLVVVSHCLRPRSNVHDWSNFASALLAPLVTYDAYYKSFVKK